MIHDPKAIKNTRKMFGNKISYSQSIQDTLDGSSLCYNHGHTGNNMRN